MMGYVIWFKFARRDVIAARWERVAIGDSNRFDWFGEFYMSTRNWHDDEPCGDKIIVDNPHFIRVYKEILRDVRKRK